MASFACTIVHNARDGLGGGKPHNRTIRMQSASYAVAWLLQKALCVLAEFSGKKCGRASSDLTQFESARPSAEAHTFGRTANSTLVADSLIVITRNS